jgi:hypothetical protein
MRFTCKFFEPFQPSFDEKLLFTVYLYIFSHKHCEKGTTLIPYIATPPPFRPLSPLSQILFVWYKLFHGDLPSTGETGGRQSIPVIMLLQCTAHPFFYVMTLLSTIMT